MNKRKKEGLFLNSFFPKNHKALSTVVTTVILIAIVFALVVIVWGVVKNIVESKLESTEACLDVMGKVEINSRYTSYDPNSDKLQFSINIGDIEVDEVLVAISGGGVVKSLTITNEAQTISGLVNYPGSSSEIKLPEKNAGLTYIYDMSDFSDKPDSIEISPVIGGTQCSVCDSLYEIDVSTIVLLDCGADLSGVCCISGQTCQGGFFHLSSDCSNLCCVGGVCCTPDCSTGPGCRSSLTNGHIVTGECCGTGNCYDCNAGYSWNSSSEICESSFCTPDCSCASGTCVGETCSDGCEGTCAGTLEPDCGTRECGPAPNGCGSADECGTCAAGSCVDGVCVVGCGGAVTFTYRGDPVTYGVVAHNGECWMDRNLGASQVAVAYNDSSAYGDLFQWGRLDDNHQDRGSGIIGVTSGSDNPGHSNFITSVFESAYDWRWPQNNNLWQGASGINNPCPNGWRIPTETEWNTERLSWISYNSNGSYASPLKLTVAGYRHFEDGVLGGVGGNGVYWSSSIVSVPQGMYSRTLGFTSSQYSMSPYPRSFGYSVRCIEDNS